MRFKCHGSCVSNKKLRSRINAYFIWFLLYITGLVNRNSQNSFAIISEFPEVLKVYNPFFNPKQPRALSPGSNSLYKWPTWSKSRLGVGCFTAHLVVAGPIDDHSDRIGRRIGLSRIVQSKRHESYASWKGCNCLRIILLKIMEIISEIEMMDEKSPITLVAICVFPYRTT